MARGLSERGVIRTGGGARVRPRPALPGQPSASAGHIAQKRSLTGHRGLVMSIAIGGTIETSERRAGEIDLSVRRRGHSSFSVRTNDHLGVSTHISIRAAPCGQCAVPVGVSTESEHISDTLSCGVVLGAGRQCSRWRVAKPRSVPASLNHRHPGTPRPSSP